MASSENYKRGQQIISADLAAERAQRLLPLDDFGLTWGGLVLPSTEAVTHFCVVGATGSGKTTLLRLLMQSCLPLLGTEFKEKSYEQDLSEVTPPTQKELNDYNAALTEYEALVAERDSALKKNQETTELLKKLNEEIEDANETTAKRIAELDRDIQDLPQLNWSIPGLKKWIIAIPVTFIGLALPGIMWIPTLFLFYGAAVPAVVVIAKLIGKVIANGRLRRKKQDLEKEKQSLNFLPKRELPDLSDIPDPVATVRTNLVCLLALACFQARFERFVVAPIGMPS